MKRCLMLLLLFSALAVQAQSTNAPLIKMPLTNTVPRLAGESLEAQTIGTGLPGLNLNELKPNEIARGRFLYSGIAVELLKKRNPLQLINPIAPPEYGSPDDNIVRDPPSGKVRGFKLFAIRF
jgi:hypothetical protein